MILICNPFGPACSPDWNALSALATMAATLAALGLPPLMARRERHKAQSARRDFIREVCSAIDRVVAYHDMASGLIARSPIYAPEIQALEQIRENTIDLRKALEILIARPELSDGAIAAAATAIRISESIIIALDKPQGLSDQQWILRRASLAETGLARSLAARRCGSVREYSNLPPSTSAQEIRDLYSAVILGCAEARLQNVAPIVPNIQTHYV